MKSTISLSLALVALILTPIVRADWVEDVVKQIRADYNATESARLTKRTIQFDDGPEVAELTKHYRGDEVVKLVFSSGSDHGAATDYYYFKNGQLYFIYQTAGSWSFDPNGPEGTTIDTGREQRIYFHDNKVIRHLVKEVSSRDANAITGLLAKASNQTVNDPDGAVSLGNTGYRLLQVNNASQLEKYIYGE